MLCIVAMRPISDHQRDDAEYPGDLAALFSMLGRGAGAIYDRINWCALRGTDYCKWQKRWHIKKPMFQLL